MQSQHFVRKSFKMGSRERVIPIVVKPSFLLLLVISLLAVPLKWLVSWLAAALVHELFHYVALCLCRISVISVTVGVGGAKISTAPLSVGQECFCALAGPFGGLVLLFLSSYAPAVAVCAFFQSTYNLLPIYPLDGGRAVYCLIQSLFKPTTAEKIMKIWAWAVWICVSVLGLWLTFCCELGLIPVAVAGFLALQNKKSLANSRGNEYNVCSYALNQ